MSPRPYKLGQRQTSSEQTRTRILAATHELLMANDGFSTFSIDAVAQQADVARMTVYHQFGSRIGLLEALFDFIGAKGGMLELPNAFRRSDAFEALDEYIMIFSRFWESDRLVTRRLRGLAKLDADFEQVVRSRDEWRRKAIETLLRRISEQHGRPTSAMFDVTVDVLYTLLSFECFDVLAGPTRSTEEVVGVVKQLVKAAIELDKE